MGKKKTNNHYHNELKNIHGDKYDLSSINYTSNKDYFIIECPLHGTFKKRADRFLISGCPECSKVERRLTTKLFKEKANKIHHNFFSYEKSVYTKYNEKIIITCPIHGDFSQIAGDHLQGYNCLKCSIEKNTQNRKLSKKQIVEKANKIHNNFYSYEKLDKYDNNKSFIIITCPIHGDFTQIINSHLSGNGCSNCGYKKASNRKKLVKDILIKKLNEIHNDFYSYEKLEYNNNKSIVNITCPIHGNFHQLLKNHISGSGCQKCNRSKGEIEVEKYLQNKKINIITQKKFKNCKNKRELPFDFYLPDYNVCIEYDGEQHFKLNDYWGGAKQFKKIKIHDQIKNNFCHENDIKLLRIRYDEDVNEKIATFFRNLI